MTEKEFYKDIQNHVLQPILDGLFAKRGELTVLAKRLEKNCGMAHARNRLAELRSGSRKLSFFFLNILIQGGVMTIDQVLKGRKYEDLSKAEKNAIRRLKLTDEKLDLIDEAEAAGLDFVQVMKAILKKA